MIDDATFELTPPSVFFKLKKKLSQSDNKLALSYKFCFYDTFIYTCYFYLHLFYNYFTCDHYEQSLFL